MFPGVGGGDWNCRAALSLLLRLAGWKFGGSAWAEGEYVEDDEGAEARMGVGFE